MKRTIWSAIILFAVMLLLCTAANAAGTTSGYCGEGDGTNLSWTLDSSGLLTIRGTGKMRDFDFGASPWYSNRASIKSVKIYSGVTSIGDFAFEYCSSLTDVTIPIGVTSIGDGAFEYCNSLTRITIPDGVADIGNSAFVGCKNLANISIPDSVTFIDSGAFSSCANLIYNSYGNALYLGNSANPYVALIKAVDTSITSCTIHETTNVIYYEAFMSCGKLSTIHIPDSVAFIGYWAFYGCSSLASATIGSSVTSIGDEAFRNCGSLTSVTLGSSVTSIGRNAFYGCNSLKNVYITSTDAWCRISFDNEYANPMYYAGSIYCNDSKLVSVTVPDGVTALDYTFYGFKDLIRVTLPNSLTAIGDYAFCNCSSLTKVTIPDSVTSIGNYAFYYCSSLTSVTIPDGVTSIGRNAFYYCSSLTSVNIPDGVTSIGDAAFYYCSNLSSVIIPDGVTSIGDYAFCDCSNLSSVTIPDGVTSIGDYAFCNCSSLTKVTIPDSVTSIGNYAFYNCRSLTSVNIPDGVTSIGDAAFYCQNLTGVYITDLDAWCRISFVDAAANPLCYAKNLYLNGVKVELLEIPESVQVISSNLFYNTSCIKAVSIPKTLVGVAANAFKNCTGIEKVFFAGSEVEWSDLAISAGNECLTGAQIFCNATASDYLCKVTCAVSPGGAVSVAKNVYAPDETVTVTATPYAGYALTEIRVDGVKIDGNTFPATGNHTVSAVFSKLPVVGGTETSRIGDISVRTLDGTPQQALPVGQCLVTVPIENLQITDNVTVMIASYTANGQYQGMAWLTFHNLPVGVTVDATLPIDNSSGKIASLCAFVVGSIANPMPLGIAVSFGAN